MSTYPYVIFPGIIDRYIKNDFVELEKIPLPDKPQLHKISYIGYLIAVGCIVVIKVLIGFKVVFWLPYLVLGILSYVLITGNCKANAFSKAANKKIRNQYNEDLKKVQLENENREKLRSSLIINNKLQEYRKQKIKEHLKRYIQPFYSELPSKKGYSENFLYGFYLNILKVV